MTNKKQKDTLSKERESELVQFIKQLNINFKLSHLRKDIIAKKLNIINEALTHSSANNHFNYEKLEFLGDAVLRLIASEFIERNFPNMKVGERSELRSQLVSDQWLAIFGDQIGIKRMLILGPKTSGDLAAISTLQADSTEALIGAFYICINDLEPIQNWLNPYWLAESKKVLADPHKQNYKSALQEWSQAKMVMLPEYVTVESSKEHGNPKRFFCKVNIEGKLIADGWGGSRKAAEKEAAKSALTKLKD